MFVEKKVSRKDSSNWLRRTNIKSRLTPKIEYSLKTSNYDAKPCFLHSIAQKSKCPRRFREIRPWNFAHVFNVSLPSLSQMVSFVFFVFFAENVESLKTQISKKYKPPNIWQQKTKKQEKNIRKRLGRGTLNTCAKCQGLSLKNGVDIGLWRNLGFYAWSSLYLVQ